MSHQCLHKHTTIHYVTGDFATKMNRLLWCDCIYLLFLARCLTILFCINIGWLIMYAHHISSQGFSFSVSWWFQLFAWVSQETESTQWWGACSSQRHSVSIPLLVAPFLRLWVHCRGCSYTQCGWRTEPCLLSPLQSRAPVDGYRNLINKSMESVIVYLWKSQ